MPKNPEHKAYDPQQEDEDRRKFFEKKIDDARGRRGLFRKILGLTSPMEAKYRQELKEELAHQEERAASQEVRAKEKNKEMWERRDEERALEIQRKLDQDKGRGGQDTSMLGMEKQIAELEEKNREAAESGGRAGNLADIERRREEIKNLRAKLRELPGGRRST